jgi:hypothetical protein
MNSYFLSLFLHLPLTFISDSSSQLTFNVEISESSVLSPLFFLVYIISKGILSTTIASNTSPNFIFPLQTSFLGLNLCIYMPTCLHVSKTSMLSLLCTLYHHLLNCSWHILILFLIMTFTINIQSKNWLFLPIITILVQTIIISHLDYLNNLFNHILISTFATFTSNPFSIQQLKWSNQPGIVVHNWNPSTLEVEAKGSRTWGHVETIPGMGE